MSYSQIKDIQLLEAENKLKEYCVSKGYGKPEFKLVSKDVQQEKAGPRKLYTIKVSIKHVNDVKDVAAANGVGLSKRFARNFASLNALKELLRIEEIPIQEDPGAKNNSSDEHLCDTKQNEIQADDDSIINNDSSSQESYNYNNYETLRITERENKLHDNINVQNYRSTQV